MILACLRLELMLRIARSPAVWSIACMWLRAIGVTGVACTAPCTQWHPDKHPDDQEEAKAKFQVIQKAYDSLMSTDEDERIEALAM